MKRVKSQLADMVCKHTNNSPAIARILGKPLTLSITWLSFKFPQSAPAEYERCGILLANNQVKWVARRYDDRQAQRLFRVIFPNVLFSSLQGLSLTLLTSHYGTLKRLWSRTERSEHQISTEMSVVSSLPTTTQNEGKSSPLASTQERSVEPQQNIPLVATPIFYAKAVRNIMHGSEPDSAVVAAAKSFKLNFVKKWNNSLSFGIRGACVVKGEIAMNGPHGRCKVSVEALYLPKENIFARIAFNNFDYWTETQAPLGKPKSGRSSKP